jgi:hypothetical protein
LKTEGILETDLEKLTSTSAWTCGATISVNCDLDNLETDGDVSTTLKLGFCTNVQQRETKEVRAS